MADRMELPRVMTNEPLHCGKVHSEPSSELARSGPRSRIGRKQWETQPQHEVSAGGVHYTC